MSASQPLRLAIVCYPTLGGSGIVATELALGLARRGHRVHLLCRAAPSRALPSCDALTFHAVNAPDYPLFEHAPYTLALANAIASLARSEPLDLVHTHYAVPHAASAYLAKQMLGTAAPRLVTTLHGTDVTHLGADPAYREITRFCVEASHGISVPSEHLRERAHALLGIAAHTPIDVIPNFVDNAHFAPAARRDPAVLAALFAEPASGPTPYLFHVSNFRPLKRVRDLLEVLARVRRSVPARMILVGDGPERASAQAHAARLGLEPHVCFLGTRPDFADYLQHADAFLLTSETESFGLAALEALSCGVPVVGYRVGGLPAVVTEQVGRLVTPLDHDALAHATLEVLGDETERARMGERARHHVLSQFRAEPAITRYEALFRRVLALG